MELGLKNKRALILGSSSGLGFGVAKALSDEGAICAITSRDISRAQKASFSINNSIPFSCDFEKPDSGKKLIQEVLEKMGGVDILITNAGGPPKSSFFETSDLDWENAYYGLFRSVVDTIKLAAPFMKEQKWGRIILLTSISSKEALPNMALSNFYRTGLMGLMRTLSSELAPFNITVNAIFPGFTRTKRLFELGVIENEIAKTIPMGRIGEVEELASLALFLASDRASYITSQAIACDGGRLKS